MELKLTHWDKEEPPTEEEIIDQLTEQDLTVYHWASPSEGVFAGHTHGYHKVIYVIEGSIKFEFPTRHQSINMNLGDRLDIPTGIRHSAVVGADGVKCLEAHVF